MAALKRGQLFLPSLLQCRTKFSSRGQINKVLPRRVFEIVTKPILPEMLETPLKQCSYEGRVKLWQEKEAAQLEENLHEQFLIRRCREMFTDNKMIIVCGRLPMTKRETMLLGKAFKRNSLHLHSWSNDVVKKTIMDTKWQNLEPVITQPNCFIYSPEVRVKDVLKVAKKSPHIFILGGIIENRLLSKDELQDMATLPSIDQLLGQTVSLLGSAAAKTHSLLNSHQQGLSRNLTQYIKDQQGDQET